MSEKKEDVIQDISAKTEKAVKALYASKEIAPPISGLSVSKDGTLKAVLNTDKANTEKSMKVLKNLMANGAKEFEERTGRPMTYSEMRAMYG